MNDTGHRKIYIGTIRDLEAKLAVGDYYSLVRASGLLRHLLIDGHCLVDRARSESGFSEKITFLVNPFFRLPVVPTFHLQDIEPLAAYSMPVPVSVKRDGFLSTPCFGLEGKDYTIHNVIDACAHVMGGVHSGKAKQDSDHAIMDINRLLKIGGLEASVAVMASIIRITLRGLKPLTDFVASQI